MYYAERKIFKEGSCGFERKGPFLNMVEVFKKIGFYHITQDYEERPKRSFRVTSWADKPDKMYETVEEKKYVIVNENGTILSKETILGEYRKFLRNWKSPYDWYSKWIRLRNGRKKSAYGGFRHPKTLNELKANESLDEDAIEYGVKIREKRKYLPTVRDDNYSHNDKSWKTQSKRRKQWKNK